MDSKTKVSIIEKNKSHINTKQTFYIYFTIAIQ